MANEKRVLIVDDEPDAIDIVEAMLSEISGIITLTANDGTSGLEKAKETKPDMIILDIRMPDKSGFEVFHEIKKDESLKDMQVVMYTGIKEKKGIGFSAKKMKKYLQNEPEAYLEKPVDAATLQNTVKKLLGM